MDNVTILNEKSQKKFSMARFAAVKILNRYERSDSYVDKLLSFQLGRENLSTVDKALLTELVNGVIRWRAKLDWVLTGFYFGEFHKCMNLVKNAMRVGLYQILFLDKIPVPAAIDESVEMIKHLQGDKAAGLVNAVLRNIARNLSNIRYPNIADDESFYYSVIHSHPKWIVKKWMADFGLEATIKLMEANNEKPYTPLRVNSLKTTSQEVLDIFTTKEVPHTHSKFLDSSILLHSHINVAQSELFKLGKITIQDTAASLVCKLANPQKEQIVLDLCSAPGGKSFYLAELMENTGKVMSVDKYEAKLKLVDEGAVRLGLSNIKTYYYDAREYKLDGGADVVLCDVPCSGTGTFSKKPDIKWKKEQEDIRKLNVMQKEILENAAKLVKLNGTLIYSTCSIEKEENSEIIDWFLNNHSNFELDNAENFLPAEVCLNGYLQTFPQTHGIDGSFGARLIRKS